MTNGPFLYDDNPEPLHTGPPRRSGKVLVLVFGGTVVVAVLMAVLLLAVKGSAEDQSREVSGVFLAALGKGDTGTAYQLLCEEARGDRSPQEALRPYTGVAGGTVGGVHKAEVDGGPARLVSVESTDGTTAELVVVPEGGSKVCGLR